MILLILSAVIALSAFVQGAVGVGFALIVAPVMSFLSPQGLPVTLLILMLPLNAYVAWREWAHLDIRGASWVTVGRVAGGWLGLLILAAISTTALNLFIGISTILAAALSLAAPSFRPGVVSLITAGVVTGVTETATGIGGPPLALVYQHEPAPTLRATIAVCFFVGQVISLVMLAATGQVNTVQLAEAAWLIPAVVVGGLASRLVHHKVNGPALRVGVMVFAIAAGAAVLLDVWF